MTDSLNPSVGGKSETLQPPVTRPLWRRYLLLFVLSWLVAAILLLPLAVVRPWLPPLPGITIGSLSGTIWNGRAVVRIVDPANPLPALILNVGLQPLSLLTLSPKLNLELDSTGVSAAAKIALGHAEEDSASKGQGGPVLQVSDLNGRISADSPWVQHYLPFAVGGRFALQVPTLSLDRLGPIDGKIHLDWQDATLDTTQTLKLGRFDGTVQLKKGAIDGDVRSVNGAQAPLRLKLHLTGQARGARRVHLTGSLGAGPMASNVLREQLRWVGRPGADGLIRIDQHLRP